MEWPVKHYFASDACQTADPGAMTSILARSRLLSWRLIMILSLRSFSSHPLNNSRRVVVSIQTKVYALEKVWLGELPVPP